MDVGNASLSPMSPLQVQTEVGMRMLDKALESAKDQGEAAIALIPKPPRVDTSSSLGRNIDVYA